MIRTIVRTASLLCIAAFVQAGITATGQEKDCTRAVLQTAVDSYLAAQRSGDSSKMLLASQVKYIENMTAIKKEEGLWNAPLPVAFHRSFLDVESCRTFTEVIVARG